MTRRIKVEKVVDRDADPKLYGQFFHVFTKGDLSAHKRRDEGLWQKGEGEDVYIRCMSCGGILRVNEYMIVGEYAYPCIVCGDDNDEDAGCGSHMWIKFEGYQRPKGSV